VEQSVTTIAVWGSCLLLWVHCAGAARHVGGAFDFISVTPPYELVVYADLMEQLSRSPLLSETTCMVCWPCQTTAFYIRSWELLNDFTY